MVYNLRGHSLLRELDLTPREFTFCWTWRPS